MAALGVGHKIEVIALRRLPRCAQRSLARIADGSGRQAAVHVSVVWRVKTKIVEGQLAVVAPDALESVNDGGIALHGHAQSKAVFEDSSDERPLFRLRRFPFDEGSQGHHGN